MEVYGCGERTWQWLLMKQGADDRTKRRWKIRFGDLLPEKPKEGGYCTDQLFPSDHPLFLDS